MAQKTTEDQLLKMGLHERFHGDYVTVIRVPGGWIYHTSSGLNKPNPVFVPQPPHTFHDNSEN